MDAEDFSDFEDEEYTSETSLRESEIDEGIDQELDDALLLQDIYPEDIEHDIYDELLNLERLRQSLGELLNDNDISSEDYDNEILKVNYYSLLKTKDFILDDDEKKIIDKIREYKNSILKNYKLGILNQLDFDKEYTNAIRQEYNILVNSNSKKTINKRNVIDPNLPISEKLRLLHEEEIKYNKSIAKKLDLEYPKAPKGIEDEELDDYYNFKMGSGENIIIEDYLSKLSAVKKIIDYNTSGFVVTKMVPDSDSPAMNFKKISPINNKFLELKKPENRSDLLSMEEKIYSERLHVLKNRMRKMSREELLQCIGPRVFKFMTYVERLKENKQTVLKFKSRPENYKILEKILKEDSKFYKIDSSELFDDYKYNLPNVLDLEDDGKDFSVFVETGSVAKLALKEGRAYKNEEELTEDDYETIKPFPDKLYQEIKDKKTENTEPVLAWELRLRLPGSEKKIVTKRYLDFKDYLTDFKNILLENSKTVKGKTRDILLDKIRKISYYITYDEDLEDITDTGQLTLSELFENNSKINEMRKNGIYKLMFYITQFYEGSQLLVEKIESDIFNFSTKNYDYNIDKVIFIFKNYSEKLEDLVERNESIINILTFEIPKTIPDDDIDIDDIPGTIQAIINWKPATVTLDKYRSKVKNNDFELFKKENASVENIEIIQIRKELDEEMRWENSLEKFINLKVPTGFIENNYKLRYLLKERNKLPSRRIFRLTTINDRMNNQAKFEKLFERCDIKDNKELSRLTEEIIYNLSTTPEDYKYYYDLVTRTYNKFCSLISQLNVDIKVESEGMVRVNIFFEPNKYSPFIIEFLVKEGDLENVEIEKLNNLIRTIKDNKLKEYINSLRPGELDAYNDILKNKKNSIWKKLIIKQKYNNFKKSLDKLIEISSNTYKPPIVSREKPVKRYFNNLIESEYIKIGDNYIYGGFYPLFNEYNKEGEIIRDNYSREDLEQLATLFQIDIIDDSYLLYKNIITFISDFDKTDEIKRDPTFYPIEYYNYYDYIKAPVKIIHYTLRPRLGVPEPGEVYNVTTDLSKTYGVPFKFDQNMIPVYSSELKNLLENSFIIIEGPAIFEDTDSSNKILSNSYILVEYLNNRGKPILFREGISKKRIIHKIINNLNTCSRFVEKMSCDSENSYSLEVKGIKYKCKWINDVCKGIIVETDELKKFNINKVSFKKTSNYSKWEEAIKKSILYIEGVTKINSLTKEEIDKISKEQKLRLLQYYKKLLEGENIYPPLSTIVEEENNVAFEIKSLADLIPKNRKVTIKKEDEVSEYKNITIYKLKGYKQKYPIGNIILDKEYDINGKIVIPKVINDDNTILAEIKETFETILLNRTDFRKESEIVSFRPELIHCLIKNVDYSLLESYRSYFWILQKQVLEKIEEKNIISKEINEVKTFVPTNFIEPSAEINGKPLIQREDVMDAIKKIAFSTLTTTDDFIYNIKIKFMATEEAIDFAISNRINLFDIQEHHVGNIELTDVISYYESLNPPSIISKTELIEIIDKGIREKDKETLKKYIIRAKKIGIEKEKIEEAKKIINDIRTKPKKESPLVNPEVLKQEKPVVNTQNKYISRRRI